MLLISVLLPACFHCVSSQCWGRHQPDSSTGWSSPCEWGEGCEAGGSCSPRALAFPCPKTALACERVAWGQGQCWLLWCSCWSWAEAQLTPSIRLCWHGNSSWSLLAWAGLHWAAGHGQNSCVSHSQLLWAIQGPVTQQKKRHFLKWGFWQMTGKQSPPHTPDSLTALNWHSFRSWDGPRAADSKTLGIRAQDWKGFVPSWLGASSLGLLCLPMLNVNQQSSSTFAKKPQVSWQIHYQASGKNPRFPLVQRRKGWSRVVELKAGQGQRARNKALHSCWSYNRHRGVFSRKGF